VTDNPAPAAGFTIHSEAHGPHWIAWLTRASETKPVKSVVVVGETREEAEQRARRWGDEATTSGYL
jgi:hypothetical protein